MDFVRLGPAYSTSYIPDILIEGYNSLIWHEKNTEPGEFELKSYDVNRLTTILPQDTLVSHLETREVMQVETHSIEIVGEGVDAKPEITITGHSATTILNHRRLESPYQTKRTLAHAYTAAGAAMVLLYNAVDNASGVDVTRPGYGWNTLDAIPNVIVTESVADEGPAQDWWVQQGMLLPQLTDIMLTRGLGIRCLRPILPNNPTVVTVDGGGNIYRTPSSNVGALCFEVYDGVDRSTSVQFSTLQGHILSPKYLSSNTDWKTVVDVMSGIVGVASAARPGEGALSGWQRKVMDYDAGSPELPDEPAAPVRPKWTTATKAQKHAYYVAYDNWLDAHAAWVNARNAVIANFQSSQYNAAMNELNSHKKLNLFAGDISDLSPYKYKVHYDLGDTVMFFGDYGKTAPMVVAEYVRTEDSTGDRGFPGLVAP